MAIELKHAPVSAMLAEDDIEAARRFWRETIGVIEVGYDDRAKVATYRVGQGTLFGIYQHAGGSKADHTQLVFEVEDVDGTVQDLRQRGITFEDYDMPGLKTQNGIADWGDGNKGAWFKDPGGNIINVVTPLPHLRQLLREESVGAFAGSEAGRPGSPGRSGSHFVGG